MRIINLVDKKSKQVVFSHCCEDNTNEKTLAAAAASNVNTDRIDVKPSDYCPMAYSAVYTTRGYPKRQT